MPEKKLLDVAHVSYKETPFGITIPRKVVNKLTLKDQDIVAFLDEDERILIESLK